MAAHFEALDEVVLEVLLDPRYTQVGFNLVSGGGNFNPGSCIPGLNPRLIPD